MKSKMIDIVMDRPIGTCHPKHPDIIYPINYGYIEGLIAPDGEEQDVYLLGIDTPLERYTGKLIAVIYRNDDVEDKWVACPEERATDFSADDIMQAVHFQEQFYDSYVEMLIDNK